MNLNNEIPTPSGVVAGSTCLFNIPVGGHIKYLSLLFNYDVATQNVSHFNEIRVIINGNVMQRFSGTERDQINQYDKIPAATNGILVIPFARQGVSTDVGEDITGINTGVADASGKAIVTMAVEIDLDAGIVVSPTDFTMYSEESKPLAGGAGILPYLVKDVRSIPAASINYNLSDLISVGVNNPQKVGLDRVHFIPDGGDLLQGNLRIRKNTETIFNRPDSLNRLVQLSGDTKVPQAGVYTIDSRERGRGGAALKLFDMVDYRYIIGPSQAMQLTVIHEFFGKLT